MMIESSCALLSLFLLSLFPCEPMSEATSSENIIDDTNSQTQVIESVSGAIPRLLNLFSYEPKSDGSVMNENICNNQNRCRYKGVVRHPNGHYGAQIYSNHQRIWIGTFKSEVAAAIAYDRAAFKLRSDDLYRNIRLKCHKATLEANFQRGLSVENVLDMIKDGSYDSHLAEFKRKLYGKNGTNKLEKTVAMKLFEKVLTRSDVGKLNRLVIPKKSAKKFQQQLVEDGWEGEHEIEIEFFDNEMRCWRFRFSYWQSSQSFVFTRGWNKFVKGKSLKEDDVVVFNMCLRKGEVRDTTFFTIDVHSTSSAHIDVESRVMNQPESINSVEEIGKSKTVRLFGVNIPCINSNELLF